MNKKDRQLVFDKFGGKCAYCGEYLKRNWHCDHVIPVNRVQKLIPAHYKHRVTGEKLEQALLPSRWYQEYVRVDAKYVFDKMLNPENDTVENSMPSCHSCNITKSNSSLEDFRAYIQQTVESLNKNRYASYKFAKRFGLVQETIKPVVFYFETLEETNTFT